MKITNLSQATAVIKRQKSELARVYGVSNIGVFGSFVFGDVQRDSDVDILVELNRPIGLFAFLGLEHYLSKKLGRKVDLVTKTGIKPYLKKDILSSVIYA